MDLRTAVQLLPTPSASVANDGEGPETWLARRERVKETANNGNGMGMPLTIAVQLLPTPRTSDTNGAGQHSTGGADLRTTVSRLLTENEAPILADDRCPTCGCPIDLHDADGFCAGRCGGNDFDCFGRLGAEHPVALLPTPAANLGSNGGPQHPDKRRAGGHSVSIEDAVHGLALLPTPTTTQRGTDANLDTREGARANLHNEVAKLLPTPSVADTQGGRKSRSGERNGELLLNGIAYTQRWGDYAPAIARWEQALGRPAPAPTEPAAKPLNRHGNPRVNPRLSARFVEWMMMLPAGWITDVPGVARTEALKILGNGVVGPQCVAALRIMLGRTIK